MQSGKTDTYIEVKICNIVNKKLKTDFFKWYNSLFPLIFVLAIDYIRNGSNRKYTFNSKTWNFITN